jgi:flagellar biosynthesis protein FlhG
VGESLGVVDILSAQRNVHEVLQPGPAGLQIVAGSPAATLARLSSDVAVQRLIDQLRSLGRHAEFVLLDMGAQAMNVGPRFWSSADLLLVVTTGDSACVMDTYASIKLLHARGGPLPRICTIVNETDDGSVASDVHRRINQSCQRFLSIDVVAAGDVPLDDVLARAAEHAVPASSQSPTCPATRAIDRIAATIMAKAPESVRPSIKRSAA